MAALINWLLAEGQTSHLEPLTERALPLTHARVTATHNKGTPLPPPLAGSVGSSSCLIGPLGLLLTLTR